MPNPRSKHTPGPWRTDGDANNFLYVVSAGDDRGKIIAEIEGPWSLSENEANASLVAAAPEMNEAVQAVLEWAKAPGDHGGNPYCKKFVQLAQKAAAKIECDGESEENEEENEGD